MPNAPVIISAVIAVGILFASAEAGNLPPSTRKAVMEAADEDVKDSAISPVPVDAASQPGYVNQTYAGYGYSGRAGLDTYTTFQLNETRAQLSVGPGWLSSKGGDPENVVSLALRYRISPIAWPISDEPSWHIGPFPLSLYVEAGGMVPGGVSAFSRRSGMFNDGSSYTTDLRMLNQFQFALVDELPHGNQSWVIPEIGVGASRTTTRMTYSVYNSQVVFADYGYGEGDKVSWNPYFQGGLHFFPDHFLSFMLEGSYIAFPYVSGVPLQSPGNGNPPDLLNPGFPKYGWLLQAKLQMKLVWPTLVHTPLVPQMMPPWVLPVYTTEEISPWVASRKTADKWNEPGRPPVGNVMFQYKNRWAQKVEIIGDFNDWKPERMLRDRSGMWLSVKDLPAGKFRYNFVVDGKKEIKDPWNKNVDPDSRARGSSLVAVQ
ncbi:MAG TPA: hypothetical protein VMU17_02885 [Elusimicrobiota bacterium]|nr:hypothetical protein [Elusimicrobiota bacterium]